MERATVVALVCIGPNGEIAKDGKLMYRLPSDMYRFKTITKLYPNMIIGRKTFDEIFQKLKISLLYQLLFQSKNLCYIPCP